ncbi:MAG: alpha/beta hydrolase [Vicinamibacterales bacterium]
MGFGLLDRLPQGTRLYRRILAGLAVASLWVHAASPSAAQQPAPAGARKFNIYLQSRQIGTEEMAVTRTPDGWTISGSGRIGPPLDVVSRKLEIRYDADWKPLEVTIDAVVRNQPATLHTVVKEGSAVTQFAGRFGAAQDHVEPIDAQAVLLPDPFFSPYEAVAARLRTAPQGATLPLYAAPAGSIVATVGESATERIQTAERLIEARRTRLILQPATGPAVTADVWGDENGRLLRLAVPAQSLEVVREDIGSVAARRVTVARPNDESVRITANGFTLAGTVSKPASPTARKLPAIVLVGGSGPTDRDEITFNIPIFGQLASRLADAGFVVVRFDRRGVGQSGGRPEAATLSDYAEDLRAVVRFTRDRKDVEGKRVTVIGYGEGGPVALLAASQEDRIGALVLIATPGVSGAEFNIERVTAAVNRSARSDADKQATIELQRKIQDAVLTGKGWEDIPPQLRRQADIPWFQSFLSFDPARVMKEVEQPVLVLRAALDAEVAASHADRLGELGKARKRKEPTDVVTVPGVNHLLVPATTGAIAEYASLGDAAVSPAVADAIASWIQQALPAGK